LWSIHTGGKGAHDDPAKAFITWRDIIDRNTDNQENGRSPYASLVEFMRTSTDRSWMD